MKKFVFIFPFVLFLFFSGLAQDTASVYNISYMVKFRPYNENEDLVWAYNDSTSRGGLALFSPDKNFYVIFSNTDNYFGDYQLFGNRVIWSNFYFPGGSIIYDIKIANLSDLGSVSTLVRVTGNDGAPSSSLSAFVITPDLQIYLFFADNNNDNIVFYKGQVSQDFTSVEWENTGNLYSISVGSDIKGIDAQVVFRGDDYTPYILVAAETDDNNLKVYLGENNSFSLQASTPDTTGDNTSLAITSGYLDGVDTANGYVQIAISDQSNVRVFSFNFDNLSLTKVFEEVLPQYYNLVLPIEKYDKISWTPKFDAIDNAHIQMYKTLAIPFRYYATPDINSPKIYNFYSREWISDKLVLVASYQDMAPLSLKDQAWNLLAVVEGPPPFALNGNVITELDDPPSTFYFGRTQEYSFTVTTNYDLSATASLGFGPVDVSVRGYYSETHESTVTQSTTITTEITPPLDENSSGYLTYIYIAPTIQKLVWEQLKNDSTPYNPPKYVSFFKFVPPQQQVLTVSMDSFPQSPNVFDIESYQNRNVQGFPGFETLSTGQLTEKIYEGVAQNLTITYSQTNANTQTKGVEVSLNVSAGFGPFETSAGVSAGVSYSETHSFTYTNSFEAVFNNPTPVDLYDTNNIREYTVTVYLMRVLNDEAYILPEAFYGTHPYFITYEVSNIVRGAFTSVSLTDGVLKVYPNPAADRIKFYGISDNSLLKIHMPDGRIVKQEIIGSKSEADISDLPPGLYLLKIYDNATRKEFSAKLIKQ